MRLVFELACLLRSHLSTPTTFDPASISHFQSYPNQTGLFYFKSGFYLFYFIWAFFFGAKKGSGACVAGRLSIFQFIPTNIGTFLVVNALCNRFTVCECSFWVSFGVFMSLGCTIHPAAIGQLLPYLPVQFTVITGAVKVWLQSFLLLWRLWSDSVRAKEIAIDSYLFLLYPQPLWCFHALKASVRWDPVHIKHTRYQMDGSSMRSLLWILSATENVLGNGACGFYHSHAVV